MNTNEYLIHTALKPDTTLAEIEKICNEAIQYNFKTVCVPPLFVKKATDIVKEKGINPKQIVMTDKIENNSSAINLNISKK